MAVYKIPQRKIEMSQPKMKNVAEFGGSVCYAVTS